MKILKGDILLVESGIICQQVNCLGIMGAGLAKQVKERFPTVFESYKEKCQEYLKISSSDYYALGQIQICPIYNNLFIANIFGQRDIGPGKKTSYDAVDLALNQLKIFTSKNNRNVYFPRFMGCGYGGGVWDVYYEIIQHHFPRGFIVDYEKDKVPYDPDKINEFKGMSIIL
ncbi:macro domain-containing protein [Patescibacteria group bacterium]|nr:macro domain-containing protein [Patescibacteria group bacterium]